MHELQMPLIMAHFPDKCIQQWDTTCVVQKMCTPMGSITVYGGYGHLELAVKVYSRLHEVG